MCLWDKDLTTNCFECQSTFLFSLANLRFAKSAHGLLKVPAQKVAQGGVDFSDVMDLKSMEVVFLRGLKNLRGISFCLFANFTFLATVRKSTSLYLNVLDANFSHTGLSQRLTDD